MRWVDNAVSVRARSKKRGLPHVAIAAVAGTVLALVVAVPAAAAPPTDPILVAPADGGVATSTAPTLSVQVSDPDGSDLSVRFEGRKKGATVPGTSQAAPFTLTVIPDTQNYSDGRQATISAQAQWILDTRQSLNTAFAVQVGDLVGDWFIPRQWNNVSNAFRVLDDGGMPYSVVPGNHDFDNVTGDVGPFNTYFPVSRFAGASWNTATTRYGGYLGQNQFGPDPIDRGNADNYALFSAGGRDWLILNLEWEAPQYALDWASRVLAAHPDRIAIMATHGFLTVEGTRRSGGQRTGGTSQQALWQNFVSTHCQIRLVIAGHEHNGDLGEARRTDANSCGQPVHQLLSDYQSRPNGGDGWLRYYTFDPAANTIKATTYSPTLQQYETDADSSFTLPFEVTPAQPAPFEPIATVNVASGATASTVWSGRDPDTEYEWRAVVDDGSTSVVSPTWSLRTPAPPEEVLAADAFSRTVSNGWGAADTGGAWTVSGGSAAFSVSGGAGVVRMAPADSREARLSAVSTTSAIVSVAVASDVAAVSGTASASVIGRLVGTSSYSARLRFEPTGVLRLYLLRNETLLDSLVGTWSPGQAVNVRLSVRGTSPTSLAAKMWPAGTAEPTGWQTTATDSTAGLQTAGIPSLRSSVSSSSSVPVTRLLYDDLRIVSGAVPPPNAPPVARFTSSASGLAVAFDASSSSDSDGTVQSYAWNFGDGTVGSGRTTSRTYAAAGTYTVNLTVTDDDGATHTTSAPVTTTAPTPNQPPVAVIGEPVITGRTVGVSGDGSSDPDGTIQSYAWTFGDGASATGAAAERTYAADGTYTITLTVTDDKGATASATRSVTVSAGAPPDETVIAADAFGRTAANAWGASDTGGTWTVLGGSPAFSVTGGQGVVALSPSHTREARLPVSTTDAVIGAQVSSTTASVGGTASATVIGRLVGNSAYSARVRFEPGGVIRLYLLRDEVALGGGSYVLPGAYVAGESISVRPSVRGTAPTALAARIWRTASAEPTSWQLQATDATSALQTAGTLSLKSSLSASATMSTQLRYDDYRVVTGEAPPPPPANTPPVARITVSTNGLGVSVDGSASTDSDGTIASYAWTFGDGGTATGATATHTYASAGTYQVRLTVTDDDGATHAATTSVTVAAPPPPPPPGNVVAADAFGRTATGAWGAADVGGTWTVLGGSAAFAVGAGVGTMTLAPSWTREARLGSISRTATLTKLTLSSDVVAVGGATSVTLVGRQVGSSVYSARVRLEPGGVIRLYLLRDQTALGSYVLPGAYQAGERLNVELSVTGTSPTALAARVWRASTPTAPAWQAQATDSTPALQAAGWVGIIGSVSSSSTVATTRVDVDDFSVTAP